MRRFPIALSTILILLSAVPFAKAQTRTNTPTVRSAKSAQCARISVSSPAEAVDGQPITFTADVSGGPVDESYTYNWTTGFGIITSGQGTSSITVDTSGIGGQSVDATVSVGGMDRACNNSARAETRIRPQLIPRRVDEFGALKTSDRNAQLDNFAIELEMDVTASGYVIAYAGRKSVKGAAAKMLLGIKDYLIKSREIDPARIVTVDGGYREYLTIELWTVPSGAAPPEISPTVDPSDLTPPPAKKKPAAKKKP